MTTASTNQKWLNQNLQTLILGFLSFIFLVVGAASYLNAQLDDEYIVYAYAHRIVTYGEVSWNTGARVEGYSSPLHLLLMVLGCWAHIELPIFSRLVSFAAAMGTVLLFLHPRFGPNRGVIALMVSAWQPFQRWSVSGLDTAIATLIGASAWSLMFAGRRSWSIGIILLTIFSVTRPEGGVWLAAGIFMRVRYPRNFGHPEATAVVSILSLALYHLLRFHYFNEFFPTPWLVKIVAIDLFHRGLHEACYESISALPLLIACFLLRRSISFGVWVPMLIQVTLLIRANGDWMGHARMLLPGVVASVAAFASSPPRRISLYCMPFFGPLAYISMMWESMPPEGFGARWRTLASVLHPVDAINTVPKVPLMDDVGFMIRRIPKDSGVQITDVGLPGNLDDIRVWDGAGLTDRVVAELLSNKDQSLNPIIRERFENPNGIWCIRYGVATDGTDPADTWLSSLFPEVATRPDQNGLFWRCRSGGNVNFDVASARWQQLLSRFPSSDEIRLRYAQFQLDNDHVDAALSTIREVAWSDTQADGWLVLQPLQNTTYVINRGWPMYQNGTIESRTMPSDFWSQHVANIDVDSPGSEGASVTLRWSPSCEGSVNAIVSEPATLSLPVCDSDQPRSLSFDFKNDTTENGVDRNIYVTLSLRDPIQAP